MFELYFCYEEGSKFCQNAQGKCIIGEIFSLTFFLSIFVLLHLTVISFLTVIYSLCKAEKWLRFILGLKTLSFYKNMFFFFILFSKFLWKLTHRLTLQCSLPVFKLKELRKVSCLIKEYKYLYNTNTRSCI